MSTDRSRQAVLVAGVLLAAMALAGGCGRDGDGDTDGGDSVSMSRASIPTTAAADSTGEAAPLTTGTPGPAPISPPISLSAPADGATVTRTFPVSGAGVAFEGTLLWELTDASGRVAAEGSATAGSLTPAPFRFSVTAPRAGGYTLTVFRVSAKDGSRTDQVVRRLTVR